MWCLDTRSFVLTRGEQRQQQYTDCNDSWTLFVPSDAVHRFLDECLFQPCPDARVIVLAFKNDGQFIRKFLSLGDVASSLVARAVLRDLNFHKPYKCVFFVEKPNQRQQRVVTTIVEILSRRVFSLFYWKKFCPQFQMFLSEGTIDFLHTTVIYMLLNHFRILLIKDSLNTSQTIRPPVTIQRVLSRILKNVYT